MSTTTVVNYRGDPALVLDGFEVHLYRNENGRIGVQINTDEVNDADQDERGVPYIGVFLNDADLFVHDKVDPDFGEGDTDTEEDERFRQKVEGDE